MSTYYPRSYEEMLGVFVGHMQRITDRDDPRSYSNTDLAKAMGRVDGTEMKESLVSRMVNRGRDGTPKPLSEAVSPTLQRIYQLAVVTGLDANTLLGIKPQHDLSELSEDVRELIEKMTEAQIEQWIDHGHAVIRGKKLEKINMESREDRVKALQSEMQAMRDEMQAMQGEINDLLDLDLD